MSCNCCYPFNIIWDKVFPHTLDNRLGIKYVSQPLQFKHEPIIPKLTHFTAVVPHILNLCNFCFFTGSLVTEMLRVQVFLTASIP